MKEDEATEVTRLIAFDLAATCEATVTGHQARWWTYTRPHGGFDGWDQEP